MNKINTIYNALKKAYSNENLNKISGKLIELYQNKNFEEIRGIAERISDYVLIDEEKDSRCFSKLIVLYHPDKGDVYRDELSMHHSNNNIDGLKNYSHIFLLNDIENIEVNIKDKNDFGFESEYVWEDERTEGDYFYDEDEMESESYYDPEDYTRTFYNEVKLRLYGKLNIEFPPYYLEEYEDFELVNCDMESLDGVEYCTYLITLDVSNNLIVDISLLRDLTKIEELYLANNQIGYIDALSNLTELNTLDISWNNIDDISPLLNLNKLRYVNLMGNPVPKVQIDKLKEKNILVMS